MLSRRLTRNLLLLALIGLGLAGCGSAASLGTPTLPLARGAHVVERSRRCDTGHNVFCGLYEVVVDSSYPGPRALMSAERRLLRSKKWSIGQGAIGQEQSAVSPDRRYRLTYSAGDGELRAIDLGWVQRPSAVSLALARAMFAGTAALEVTVAAGPS